MGITKELIKIFTDWTKLKIRIHTLERISIIFPKKKEIWWASLGQNVGVETNGKNDNYERPVLIVKVFSNKSILILPISSKVKNGKYLIEFKNVEGQNNTINLSQLRTISTNRLLRLIGEIEDKDFVVVKNSLRKFF